MAGLLGNPQQPQRYSLLSPDAVAGMDAARNLPVRAPAAPQRPRVNGLRVAMRTLFDGSDPFSAMDAERARLEQEAMRPQLLAREAARRSAADAMGPAAMIAYDTNPEAFGESLGMQYRPVTTAAGSRTTIGTGPNATTIEQPTFDTSGDTTVRRDSKGVTPVYTRTNPSISERVNQGELGVKQQLADQAQDQFGQRLELDRSRFASDEEYRQAQLDLEQRKFRSAQDAPRPGDNEDRAAMEGYAASNARFQTQLRNIGGDPATGVAPQFDLSPANALRYRAALATGVGMSPEAAAYGDYVSEIKAAVSDSLRNNVGPQTDQDAIREAQALLSNIDNKEYVMRRLPTVMANNDRLRASRQRQIAQRRPGAGSQPQLGGGQAAAAGPIAQDAQGNRVQWNGSAWVPM